MEIIKIAGIQPVLSAVQAKSILKLWMDKNSHNSRLIEIKNGDSDFPIIEASRSQLAQMVGEDVHHQGVVADIVLPSASLETACAGDQTLVVLDGVTDPRNLGAIMRTAQAFSVGAIIMAKHRSAPLSAVVARVSCGAIATLPIIRIGNIARALKMIGDSNRWIIGACETGDKQMFVDRLPDRVCWVLGDEGNGLKRLTREGCDELMRIPTVQGREGCLNVSNVFAICMAAQKTSPCQQ